MSRARVDADGPLGQAGNTLTAEEGEQLFISVAIARSLYLLCSTQLSATARCRCTHGMCGYNAVKAALR
jgi:hypothetical protein